MPGRESSTETRNLRCFVACAFGKDDVDKVFDSLHRALRSIGVAANRVDRTNHNRNVDEKIIDMIRDSDFCICDLTYARPSAYFEAGMAEGRGLQVIYICRSDHQHPSVEPCKIHFDVQMRNIIWWSGSGQDKFVKDICRRVSHVAKPIRERLKRESVRTEEQIQFSKTSLIERLSMLVDEGRLVLQKSSIWKSPRNEKVTQRPSASDVASFLVNNRGAPSRMRLFSLRKSNTVAFHVCVIASDNIGKDLFLKLLQRYWSKYDIRAT